MGQAARKVFALLATLGGVCLLWFEWRRFRNDGETWFWIIVAALVIILGVLEMTARTPPSA